MHNWANTLGSYNRPDKEGHAGHGNEKGFDGEEMADLVHGEPDSWKRAKPEEEEGKKIPGVGAGGLGH